MTAPRLKEWKRPMRGVREQFGSTATRLPRIFVLAGSLVGFVFGVFPSSALFAQHTTGVSNAQKYSPDVVAKATKILEEIGLRQSGKTIVATNTTELSRAMTSLGREKRHLKLVHKEWENARSKANAIREEIRRLNVQDGELNLQLARIAGADTQTNNRMVALINAGRAKIKLLATDAENASEIVGQKRNSLSEAESAYAETILAIRKDFEKIRSELTKSLADQKAKIALQVMHRNHQTPAPQGLTASKILTSLEKRLGKIEQEVFSESIELSVESNGSMYVDVVVGTKSIRMVVDSGASFVTLPAHSAKQLGIAIPPDAPAMRLIMADGREIPAKRVQLARVRVGEFEAESVHAAVLDSSATNAEPLLGMSFLGNFKFELNASSKTLKLLRVSTQK